MPGNHAFLPPSGANEWLHCAAWPTMNNLYPQEDTPESIEGDAAHWALRESLSGRDIVLGQVAPNGHVLDDDMLQGAATACAFIRSRGYEHNQLFIEHTLPPGSVHGLNSGTPDVFAFQQGPGGVLVFDEFDYKHGHGFIPAFENWQLLNYALLILDHYGFVDTHVEINLHIIQPRNYHRLGPVRSWRIDNARLRTEYAPRLRAAAQRATTGDRMPTAGEHCEHCPGRVPCEANQQAAFRIADFAVSPEPFDMTAQQIGRELRLFEYIQRIIKSRVSGLRAVAQLKYEKGDRGFGYALERSGGKRVWTADVERVIDTAAAFGVAVRKPTEAITPLQAITAGVPESVVKSLSEVTPGSLNLVPDDQTLMAQIFGKK